VPRVVVQGRIAPSKQLDTICEAMPFVWALRPDVELHIFGQAELRHSSTLSSLFEQVGEDFGRRIVFHGARPDLGAELSTFDVAVVLGEHQGCPNTVLEAIAAEVPVVANDSGGTREQITHGDTGWLLPEKTGASDIAQMILLVLGQPAIARAAALKAKTHIGRLFSMPQMCANYTNLFLTL